MFDPLSFLLGVAFGLGLALAAYRYRHLLAEARRATADRAHGLAEALTAGIERSYRQDVVRHAQTQHLAVSLFALDDILVQPRVLAAPPLFDPTGPPPDEDINSVIPVLP